MLDDGRILFLANYVYIWPIHLKTFLFYTRLAHAARLGSFYKNALYKFTVIIIIITIIRARTMIFFYWSVLVVHLNFALVPQTQSMFNLSVLNRHVVFGLLKPATTQLHGSVQSSARERFPLLDRPCGTFFPTRYTQRIYTWTYEKRSKHYCLHKHVTVVSVLFLNYYYYYYYYYYTPSHVTI